MHTCNALLCTWLGSFFFPFGDHDHELMLSTMMVFVEHVSVLYLAGMLADSHSLS